MSFFAGAMKNPMEGTIDEPLECPHCLTTQRHEFERDDGGAEDVDWVVCAGCSGAWKLA